MVGRILLAPASFSNFSHPPILLLCVADDSRPLAVHGSQARDKGK